MSIQTEAQRYFTFFIDYLFLVALDVHCRQVDSQELVVQHTFVF